ncbi:MAG: DUF3570 domain-containing protein [Kofleriaceae bacterium]
MRLQLIALVASAIAHAEPEGDHVTAVIRNSAYVDNDRTTVDTTVVAAHGKPTADLAIDAHYVADAVSSASVDVITAATGRFTELRQEAMVGATYNDGTSTATASYVYSEEHDWHSSTFGGALGRDFYHHNLTLGIGGGFVDNHVGRSGDMNFARRMRVYSGSAHATWVATRHDLFDLSYELGYTSGYQASPYRYVFVADPSGAQIAYAETDPDQRTRHSLTLRWNHHVGADSALRSHARAYVDDWGVRSVTAGTAFAIGLEPFELAPEVRLYAQRGAEFYRDGYATAARYMTADRELSMFQDLFAGLRLRWLARESLQLDVAAMGFAFRFPEFHRLPSREGLLLSVGLIWAL